MNDDSDDGAMKTTRQGKSSSGKFLTGRVRLSKKLLVCTAKKV